MRSPAVFFQLGAPRPRPHQPVQALLDLRDRRRLILAVSAGAALAALRQIRLVGRVRARVVDRPCVTVGKDLAVAGGTLGACVRLQLEPEVAVG